MRFLICTDVAARGIDITGIPYVVNVTLPDDKQNYVHRIGRVGRAERMGLAISLVSKVKEKVSLATWHSADINYFSVWYLLPFKDILQIKKSSTFLSFCVFCIPQILNTQIIILTVLSNYCIPQVWYHTCPSRGKSCRNTSLVENGGCAIWYNEMQVR